MAEVEINAREDGPYLVSGPVVVIDAEGNASEIKGKTAFLCRCGGSQRKPFCDGTHRKLGFKAAPVTVRLVETAE